MDPISYFYGWSFVLLGFILTVRLGVIAIANQMANNVEIVFPAEKQVISEKSGFFGSVTQYCSGQPGMIADKQCICISPPQNEGDDLV